MLFRIPNIEFGSGRCKGMGSGCNRAYSLIIIIHPSHALLCSCKSNSVYISAE